MSDSTPASTCPICHSTFCCCLEHLFPDLGQEPFRKKAGLVRTPQEYNKDPDNWRTRYGEDPADPLNRRYKPVQAEPSHHRYQQGQAEPQVKLGPESLSQESCTWPHSVSGDGGLLPSGVGADRTPVSGTVQAGQTQRASLLEAFANILIGFWVSVGANMLVLPFFKHPGLFRQAFTIGLIFTLISFIRSYLLRRLFNLFHIRQNRRSPWKP